MQPELLQPSALNRRVKAQLKLQLKSQISKTSKISQINATNSNNDNADILSNSDGLSLLENDNNDIDGNPNNKNNNNNDDNNDDGDDDDDEMYEHDLEYVTLVGLGVNCPRCGTATETHDDDISCDDGDNFRAVATSDSIGLEKIDKHAKNKDGRGSREKQEDRGSKESKDDNDNKYDNESKENRDNKENKENKERKESQRKMNVMWCSPCGDYALSCSLCQMAIRGAGYFCTACGHGGHTGDTPTRP